MTWLNHTQLTREDVELPTEPAQSLESAAASGLLAQEQSAGMLGGLDTKISDVLIFTKEDDFAMLL